MNALLGNRFLTNTVCRPKQPESSTEVKYPLCTSWSKGWQFNAQCLACPKPACCLAHRVSLPSDLDGHFLLQPDKTYSFQFGFELPTAGWDPLIISPANHGLMEGAWRVLCYAPCRHLVSSYRGKFGYVRYYVRAVLERPGQPPLQCEREFEVEEPLDVNRPDLLVLRHNQIPTLPRGLNPSPSRHAHFGAHGANTILAPVVTSNCASMSVFRKI